MCVERKMKDFKVSKTSLTVQGGQHRKELVTCAGKESNSAFRKVQRSYLQELPEELLEQIIQDVSFGGLRLLLHSGCEKLSRLARVRLHVLHKELQARPGGFEETKFIGHLPFEQPWPRIEIIAMQFLGKEFIPVNSRFRDEFVSVPVCPMADTTDWTDVFNKSFSTQDLPLNHEIRREYTIKGIDYRPLLLLGTWPGNKLLVFLRQGICWKVRWSK